jgi:hypothetical protein
MIVSTQRLQTAASFQIEFLKSGKLVSGPDERVPYDEGYSVTRRSAGIGRYSALLTSKDVLGERLSVLRVDPDVTNRPGVFVLRRLPGLAPGLPPKLVMMRARILAENGKGGLGRTFQQAEFWVVDWRDWLCDPGRLLVYARDHLVAVPDSIDEPERDRLCGNPIHLGPRDREAGRRATIAAASDGTIAVLHHLLEPHVTEAVRVDGAARDPNAFGLGQFADEAAFLTAVAGACDIMASIGPEHPERDRIARILDELELISGYSGPAAGPDGPRLEFRRGYTARPPLDLVAARERLEVFFAPVRKHFRDPIPLAPTLWEDDRDGRGAGRPAAPGGGDAELPGQQRIASWSPREMAPDTLLESFGRAFDAARRQRAMHSTRSLIETAGAIVSAYPAMEGRVTAPRLSPDARRFLAGMTALVAGPHLGLQATFIELWTVVDLLAVERSGHDFQGLLERAVHALRTRIARNSILIPEELGLLASLRERRARPNREDDSAPDTLDEIYQAIIRAEPGADGVSFLEPSWWLRDWLRVAEGSERSDRLPLGEAAPLKQWLDQVLDRLQARFSPDNWTCLDREISTEFAMRFMPAFVVSCFGFDINGQTLGPGIVCRPGPPLDYATAARTGRLTLSLMKYIATPGEDLQTQGVSAFLHGRPDSVVARTA